MKDFNANAYMEKALAECKKYSDFEGEYYYSCFQGPQGIYSVFGERIGNTYTGRVKLEAQMHNGNTLINGLVFKSLSRCANYLKAL